MTEIIVPTRRYSAAISYRRVDGTRAATRLRSTLRRYRLPRGFNAAPLREIYLDRAYQRADPRFFDATVKPALADADHLIVIVTPAVFARKEPDEPNWVEREVAWFRDDLQRGDKIIIARADDEPGSRLPAFLTDYEAADQVDVRGFGSRLWRWLPSVGTEVARIVATLIDTRKLPELRREEENARTVRLVIALVAAIAVAGTTTALATAAWLSRQAEQRAAAQAEQRTIEALRAAIAREAARREAEAEKQRAELEKRRAEEQTIQTESARLETRRTFARADLETAISLVEKDEGAKALAYLARAVRTDPENAPVRGLIYDFLLRRHWALPLAVLPRDFSTKAALVKAMRSSDGTASERVRRALHAPPIRMPLEVDGEVLASNTDGTIYFARSLQGQSWIFDARKARVLASKQVVNYARPHVAVFSPTEPLVAISPSDPSRCTSVFQYDGTRRYGPFCHDRDPEASDERYSGPGSIAFSPDGRSLASGGEDLRVWDLASGAMKVCRTTSGPLPYSIDRIGYVNSEEILVSNSDGITLWTPDSDGCTSRRLARNEGRRRDFVWLRTGLHDERTHMTATVIGSQIQLWQSRSPEEPLGVIEAGANVTAVSASADGTRVAAAMGNDTSRVWSTRDNAPLVEPFDGSAEQLSADGEMILGTHDGETVVWSVGGGAAIPRLIEDKSPEELFRIQRKRDFSVAITRQDRIEVRDAASRTVAHLDVPGQRLDVFAVRDDGLIAIGGWSRTILWNYRTGERAELRYEADRATPESMEFSRDGSQLLMSRDLLYELWSVAERRRLRKWPQRGTSVEFSGDSRFVIEAGDGIQLFETATGKPASSRTFLEGGLTGAILTPDHSRVFAGEWLWDRVSGRRLGTSLGADVYAFSPDGEQLAASIDNETYIIDVPDGDPADAPYLAAVAELIGGWHLDDASQLRRRPLKMRTLAQLRALALPLDASDEARKVAAWLTQDRGTRGANPWTRQTLADVISRCKERMSVKPNGCAPVSRYIPDPSI